MKNKMLLALSLLITNSIAWASPSDNSYYNCDVNTGCQFTQTAFTGHHMDLTNIHQGSKYQCSIACNYSTAGNVDAGAAEKIHLQYQLNQHPFPQGGYDLTLDASQQNVAEGDLKFDIVNNTDYGDSVTIHCAASH
jgi:hypothetical protein